MADTVLVSENPNVKELMEVLRTNKMATQSADLSQLLNYVDTMEKQFDAVLSELNSVRKQLNEIKDKQNPVKAACIKMVNSLKSVVTEAKEKLNEIKSAIVDGAKKALTAFKENGLSALNSIMSFFKVKDGLTVMRNSVDKSIASAEKSIAKVEKISVEIHSMGSHARNIGRAAAGKETKNDVKANGKIMKIVQSPFRAVKSAMNGIKKAVSSAIKKLDQLDRTVEQNREKSAAKAKKPSILQNIANYKPPVKEAAGVDKSKKQETSL